MSSGLNVDRVGLTYRQYRGQVSEAALTDISFTLEPGSSIGVVGESGSGKSSLGLCITGLIQPTEGHIALGGVPVTVSRRGRNSRPRVQMIFQSSAASLNPRRTIGHSIGLPLVCSGASDIRNTVMGLLERVGLSSTDIDKYPREFSGGQRQRINIARALASKPDLIVCDEPTSGLDVSVQAHICMLLRDISRDTKVSFVFISHDLPIVQLMVPDLIVLHRGRLVDRVTSEALPHSSNPCTRTLLDAIPGFRHGVQANTSPTKETV